MRHLLISIFALTASLSFAQSRPLLTKQPVLNQMTGNCYTHSGTDVLAGIFIKNSRGDSVVQPHPLMLGGIVSAHVGRANISSGNTCAFFNEAKRTRGEVCSVQAFNRFIANRPGMTANKLASNIDTLDNSLSALQSLFNKERWNRNDKQLAEKSANNIISSICNLNGVLNLSDGKFAQLVDDARDIIEVLGAERNPASIGDYFQWGMEEFTSLISSGIGPYLFRRAGDATGYVGELMRFDDNRKNTINRVLNESYQSMNSRCVSYARSNNLPRVPSDFFTASGRYTCHDEYFKTPRLSKEEMMPRLNHIERQVAAGYPTTVGICSGAFYGKYPKVNGYRSSRGECVNGGGHAVTVTGVEMRNGKKMFRIRNSWGTDSCGGVTRGRRECEAKGESGCPGPSALDCEKGVYFMSEDYLSKVLYRYGRLTIARQ